MENTKKVGERLHFHLTWMAMMMMSGRDEAAQEQFEKALKIATAMKEGKEVVMGESPILKRGV